MRRRTMLAAGGGGLALAGCGFALRGAPTMAFTSLALVGFQRHSALERALRAQLMQAVRIVDDPARADVILQSLRDARDRIVVANTAAGQVREFQLRVRLQWRASTPKGRELIGSNELLLTRDMSYTETDALAKEQESETLYTAMDEDIASQVLRRLATIKPAALGPQAPAAPASAPAAPATAASPAG